MAHAAVPTLRETPELAALGERGPGQAYLLNGRKWFCSAPEPRTWPSGWPAPSTATTTSASGASRLDRD